MNFSAMLPSDFPVSSPEEIAKLEAVQKRGRLEQRINVSGIPRRFRNADLAKCDPKIRQWASDSGRGNLIIRGPVGTAKTYSACAAILACDKPFLFATATDLVTEIKGAYGNGGDELSVVDKYGSVPLLCIDDLGAANPNDKDLSRLFSVIDRRWANERPTVVTTMYEAGELVSRIAGGASGDRERAKAMLSRLLDGALVVHTDGKDRRRS